MTKMISFAAAFVLFALAAAATLMQAAQIVAQRSLAGDDAAKARTETSAFLLCPQATTYRAASMHLSRARAGKIFSTTHPQASTAASQDQRPVEAHEPREGTKMNTFSKITAIAVAFVLFAPVAVAILSQAAKIVA